MIRGSLSTKKQSYNYYNDFKHKETNAVKLWSHEIKNVYTYLSVLPWQLRTECLLCSLSWKIHSWGRGGDLGVNKNRLSAEFIEILSLFSRRSRVADDFHEITGKLKTWTQSLIIPPHIKGITQRTHTVFFILTLTQSLVIFTASVLEVMLPSKLLLLFFLHILSQ